MDTFKTTLGLETHKGGVAFSISFSIDARRKHVTPAKNSRVYTVNTYSLRHQTSKLYRFTTAYQASQFIEDINKDGIFIANIIK